MMALWYHYAILFEALFILTTVDAGTRVGRFMIQELAGMAWAPLKQTESWIGNIVATVICVGLWGYFLYQGAVDPLGGINTLWPLFGIANQMLAAIALTLASVCLVRMKRERYLWIVLAPMAWLVVCTLTAGWQKIFDDKISFTAAANKYADAMAANTLLAPAKNAAEMQRIVTNNYVDMAGRPVSTRWSGRSTRSSPARGPASLSPTSVPTATRAIPASSPPRPPIRSTTGTN